MLVNFGNYTYLCTIAFSYINSFSTAEPVDGEQSYYEKETTYRRRIL